MKEIKLNDSGVIYNEEKHTYRLEDGTALKGITSTLIDRAYPKDKTYGGISEEVLNHAAERGSACHQSVGNYYELGMASTGYETITEEAVRLLESEKLKPLRFEYVVSDGQHYASPIDCLCVNDKDEIVVVDFKFTSSLHFPQVTLQTSIYKRFFHIVNPDLEVSKLYVLWVHTSDALDVKESGIYELTPVSDEFLDDLIDCDINDKPFDVGKYYGDLPSKVASVEKYMVQLQTLIKQKTEEMDTLKDGLCKLMEQYNIKSYSSQHLQLTRVLPKARQSFDTTRFKKDHKDLYEEYIKTSQVKSSIRITIK